MKGLRRGLRKRIEHRRRRLGRHGWKEMIGEILPEPCINPLIKRMKELCVMNTEVHEDFILKVSIYVQVVMLIHTYEGLVLRVLCDNVPDGRGKEVPVYMHSNSI